MVRPEEFESPASWFVAKRSIQMSYGRKCLMKWSVILDSNQWPFRPKRNALTRLR